MALIEFEDLPSTNTPLNAVNLNNNFNEINNKIPNVENTYSTSQTDTYSCNYVNGLHTYSTNEQRIGTWINGKPLYRKIVEYTNNETIGQSGTSTTVYITHNINDLDLVVSINGFSKGLSQTKTDILPNFAGTNTITTGTLISTVNLSNIALTIINDTFGAGRHWYFVIEYTKTTD